MAGRGTPKRITKTTGTTKRTKPVKAAKTSRTTRPVTPPPRRTAAVVAADLATALAALEAKSSARDRANLARFGIDADPAFGVSMAHIHAIAKRLGRSHELAAALWKSGWYEARLLAAFVDEPDRVTVAQMDRWCRDFDNWAICDTLCFKLFDRTPHAWGRVAPWCDREPQFVKRSGFVLIACLGVHDPAATDDRFLAHFPRMERDAFDPRHLVRKGVSWALRVTGRRNHALHAEAVALAKRLAGAQNPGTRALGKEVLRELSGALVRRKLAEKKTAAAR